MTQSATVKRYYIPDDAYSVFSGGREFVLATDYDALAAQCEALQAQLSACQARVEEAQKDARRYRWLRTRGCGARSLGEQGGTLLLQFPTTVGLGFSPDRIDASIDSALGAYGGGTKT